MFPLFHVFQTQIDQTDLLVASCVREDDAQDEVDRINSHLGTAGVPSYISCAYYEPSMI